MGIITGSILTGGTAFLDHRYLLASFGSCFVLCEATQLQCGYID